MNNLWEKLCSEESLNCGWHLTRADMNQDYVHDHFSKESFTYFLDENLQEILRLLKADKFRPHSLTRVAIPKGSLGLDLLRY